MKFLFECSTPYVTGEISSWPRRETPYLQATINYFVYYTNILLTSFLSSGNLYKVFQFVYEITNNTKHITG